MSGRGPGLLPNYSNYFFIGLRGKVIQVKQIIALSAGGSHCFGTVFEGGRACTAGLVLILWANQSSHWLITWGNSKVFVGSHGDSAFWILRGI